MHNGFYMQKYKYNKKEWQKLSPTHLSKLDELVGPIAKHNYLVQLGVIKRPPITTGRYANNQSAIERGFSLRLVKLGHR